MDTREFKQQQEAVNRLTLEYDELTQNARQAVTELEQRKEELKNRIEEYVRQAEQAEKVLQEDAPLPKATIFNYPSVLEKASSIIRELKKALADKHMLQESEERLQRNVVSLRRKQMSLEAELAAHKKQSLEERKNLEAQLKKMKAIMGGYREFLILPEIRPLHQEFVERKQAEQLQQRQEEERLRQLEVEAQSQRRFMRMR
ncbi:MAG: hypothetical protein IJA79_07330 [Desulfovibrio sp.]|nr:hypothetical protein [Desulfovibrio sp.]